MYECVCVCVYKICLKDRKTHESIMDFDDIFSFVDTNDMHIDTNKCCVRKHVWNGIYIYTYIHIYKYIQYIENICKSV